MARISKTMVSNSDKSERPCLVPDLKGNALFFTIENDVCCGFVVYGLYMLAQVPSKPTF